MFLYGPQLILVGQFQTRTSNSQFLHICRLQSTSGYLLNIIHIYQNITHKSQCNYSSQKYFILISFVGTISCSPTTNTRSTSQFILFTASHPYQNQQNLSIICPYFPLRVFILTYLILSVSTISNSTILHPI